jgi:hypothetical protein
LNFELLVLHHLAIGRDPNIAINHIGYSPEADWGF